MKIFFLIISICILSSILCEDTYIYRETEETIRKRAEFNRNYTQLITGGKVAFEYDEIKGTHCVAKEDIEKKEFAFKVPKEFTICSFEMFPYKFEIKEAMMDYMISR